LKSSILGILVTGFNLLFFSIAKDSSRNFSAKDPVVLGTAFSGASEAIISGLLLPLLLLSLSEWESILGLGSEDCGG